MLFIFNLAFSLLGISLHNIHTFSSRKGDKKWKIDQLHFA